MVLSPVHCAGDGVGEFVGGGVAAAQRAVGADKVGIAELAGGGGAVLFAAAPEVAAGKTAKYRRTAGMRAFALQGQEYLFDRVTHYLSSDRISPATAEPVCRSASPNAMAAAMATLSERKPGLIGITSRASAAAATSSVTPADSRPNSRTSSALVAEIQIGTGSLGRKQHQPETRLVTPLLEF